MRKIIRNNLKILNFNIFKCISQILDLYVTNCLYNYLESIMKMKNYILGNKNILFIKIYYSKNII